MRLKRTKEAAGKAASAIPKKAQRKPRRKQAWNPEGVIHQGVLADEDLVRTEDKQPEKDFEISSQPRNRKFDFPVPS
jgi:hypothetical protein